MLRVNIFSLLLLLATIATYALNSALIEREVVTVPFCELTAHPDQYAGKVIRTRVRYFAGVESSGIYSEECHSKGQMALLSIECESEKDCKERSKKIYGIIEREKHLTSAGNTIDFTLIGRLEGPGVIGYGHLNGFKFMFFVREIEAVFGIPLKKT